MTFWFYCANCKRRIRHKGKRSEIDRGRSIACSRCGKLVSIDKKPNGRIVVNQK